MSSRLRHPLRSIWKALKQAASDFSDDECMTSGAALAYYTIFSLPPLLVIVFFVARQFGIEEETIDRTLRDQLGMPFPAGESITPNESSLQSGAMVERLGAIGKAAGVAVLVFSATSVFGQLQAALNRAWEVMADPEQGGVMQVVAKRLVSLGMIVVIAFLLLVSLVTTTVIDEIIRFIAGEQLDSISLWVAQLINGIASLAMGTLLFAAMFKVLPDAEIRWRDTWIGAGLTALLFVLGKEIVGLYLNHASIGSAWGAAAGSMIALLVWVYYSSLIVLFGAELTQAWAVNHGRTIAPSANAVRVDERRLRREHRAAIAERNRCRASQEPDRAR